MTRGFAAELHPDQQQEAETVCPADSGKPVMSTSSADQPEEYSEFRDLIRRVREKDSEAERELFETYGPVVRSIARVQFTDSWVRSQFDSEEILITTMRSLYEHLAPVHGYVLETPGQLVALLRVITERKYLTYLRRVLGSNYQRPVARSDRGIEAVSADRVEVDEVGCRDLLRAIRERLPPLERWLLDLRLEGYGWREIRDEVGHTGQTQQALSNRLRRAVSDILQSLGFSEDLGLLDDDDEL